MGIAMAGAMMVERAGSIPAMEPMDYKEFVAKLEEEQNREMDEEQLREMEASALDIGQKMREEGKAQELGNLIKLIRPFTKLLSKAKAAKLIRGLVDMYLDMGAVFMPVSCVCSPQVRKQDLSPLFIN